MKDQLFLHKLSILFYIDIGAEDAKLKILQVMQFKF